MIKLIACDCDGTLLNKDGQLENKTVDAILRFQKTGGIFMLATGRNIVDAAIVTDKVKNCVLNCDDGCSLYDQDGRKLLIHRIRKELMMKIHDLSRHYDFPVLFHGLKNIFTDYDYELFRKRALHQLDKRYDPDLSEEFFDWIFDDESCSYNVDMNTIMLQDVIRLEPIAIDERDYELVCEECLKYKKDVNITIDSFLSGIVITSRRSDKGQTLKEYCRLKGIEDDEVIVIGDSVNDISMFKLFDNSYCVGNGQEEALKAARYIIKENDGSGVAKLIEAINNVQ